MQTRKKKCRKKEHTIFCTYRKSYIQSPQNENEEEFESAVDVVAAERSMRPLTIDTDTLPQDKRVPTIVTSCGGVSVGTNIQDDASLHDLCVIKLRVL